MKDSAAFVMASRSARAVACARCLTVRTADGDDAEATAYALGLLYDFSMFYFTSYFLRYRQVCMRFLVSVRPIESRISALEQLQPREV